MTNCEFFKDAKLMVENVDGIKTTHPPDGLCIYKFNVKNSGVLCCNKNAKSTQCIEAQKQKNLTENRWKKFTKEEGNESGD